MRTLKQNFGPSSLLAIGSAVASIVSVVVVILFTVGSPVARQVEINAASTTQLKGLEQAAKENKEQVAATLNEIKSLVQQNRDEVRSMRTSIEGELVELRQDTKGLWKWSTAIDGRVGILEAEIKMQQKEKK